MTLFQFENTYAQELPGLVAPLQPGGFPAPEVVALNLPLASELGLDIARLRESAAAILSGNKLVAGSSPIAQGYAGHQFGNYSPVLGDGRAVLLGELIDSKKRRRDVQLKGSGPTPFSRGGDGKAALGPVLREYLVAEAMHHLGVPTTRVLAALTTGESIRREGALPGAVLTRIADSHLRVGTFELASHLKDPNQLRLLTAYAIRRHYPELVNAENPYLEFLLAVSRKQAALIASWMGLGFIHGVMNTDNTTISGETIDYGPCAFMDTFDPKTVFSSIDRRGRYAYGNQPTIGAWNMTRLAAALDGLSADGTKWAEAADEAFKNAYEQQWLVRMRAKLGLDDVNVDDKKLAQDFLDLLQASKVDFTRGMRGLAAAVRNDFGLDVTVYGTACASGGAFDGWLARYRKRIGDQETEAVAVRIEQVNPLYIPRNYQVEEVLSAAVNNDDFEPFHKMVAIVRQPFVAQKDAMELDLGPPDDFGPYQTFCGT